VTRSLVHVRENVENLEKCRASDNQKDAQQDEEDHRHRQQHRQSVDLFLELQEIVVAQIGGDDAQGLG